MNGPYQAFTPMITPVNIILILIWALIVPCLAGRLLVLLTGPGAKGLNIGTDIAYGFMVMCVLFIIPAIPMILLHAPFHILKYTWIFLMAAVCVASVIFSIRAVISGKVRNDRPVSPDSTQDEKSMEAVPGSSDVCNEENSGSDKGSTEKRRVDTFTVSIWIAALAIIIFETGLLTFRMHTDTDDARFIVDAMEALSRDTLLEYNPITGVHHGIPVGEQIKDVTAPYPIFIALLSSVTKLHPAIMAHTVMPVLFIPLSYLVFSMIGGVIFGKDLKMRGLFLLFLSLIHLFSFETIYSAGYTLLTIIWQGRSIVAMIMLPLTWCLLLKAGDKEKIMAGDYAVIGISALANAMLSNMGSLFAFILCMAYGLSFSLQDKKIKTFVYMGLAMVPDLIVIVVSRVLYTGILYK